MLSLSLRQTQVLRLQIAPPVPVDWNPVNAVAEDAKHGFVFPLTHLRQRLPRLEKLSHEERLQFISAANEVFRYEYSESEDCDEDGETTYYRIPLMRNWNVEIDEIAEEISFEEYKRAKFITENVGRLERIARAVPYHELYEEITGRLRRAYGAKLKDVVLVSVDRGGRFPAEILCRALDKKEALALKVCQGSGQLDEDMLEHFAETGAFKDKHILFVDSTVDSGRQIAVLEEYLENDEWKERLGFTDWSIVGSNEDGRDLNDRHLNVNWGVDPDETFEDDPLLMGVDYAPGTTVKVVEAKNPQSEKIREVFFSVPDGYYFDADDYRIDDLMHSMEQEVPEEISTRIGKLVETISSEEDWNEEYELNFGDDLPFPENERIHLRRILVSGGHTGDLEWEEAQMIASSFDEACELVIGTSGGNPGMVMEEWAGEKRRWGGHYNDDLDDEEFQWREEMMKDCDAVLVLGGKKGTLLEALMALKKGMQVYVVEGWDSVGRYFSNREYFKGFKNLHVCMTVADALKQLRADAEKINAESKGAVISDGD
jgi:hypoxanthine phosphoribosyltransferase/predicted Rossmann-fold nucleotide-binding protein